MDSIHDFVVAGLKARRYTEWRQIADAAGVPLSTVCKVAYGHSKHPRIDTLEKLAAHLSEKRAA